MNSCSRQALVLLGCRNDYGKGSCASKGPFCIKCQPGYAANFAAPEYRYSQSALRMLYRIAEPADWEQAQQTGFFASADLKLEGFIHCSEAHQILETARRYYAQHAQLWLLELDEAELTKAGVRVEREWVESRQQHFAHVFGPVPRAAVRRVWQFGTNAAGEALLPADL